MDITRNAIWTPDCCGKQDLDFNIIRADTRYYPDFTAICCISLCPGDYYPKYREYIEQHDSITLVKSDWISGESEDEVKAKVLVWYNDNILIALEKARDIIRKEE